ncbi:M36 family metallopeptidase [Altibacter sp. HG106]|uniref:M36 family metallopeptidase n=1 Tax=Altibacter sp. HG106 TaxID=3023937 RepID=UPI002350BE9A|nr:M36 family metallopeptidase [Altibacter sp. HG106]MDC7993856.1 M36 family metallopeptidase [Altibacter sp. HG106]
MKRITMSMLVFLFGVFCVQAQSVSQQITEQLVPFVENNQLNRSDLQWQITSEHISSVSGVHHVYFVQTLDGIPIQGTASGIHIAPSGKVVSSDLKFLGEVSSKRSGNTAPAISAVQAVQRAASQLGYSAPSNLSVVEAARGVTQTQKLSNGGISLREIPASLVYQRNQEGALILSWDIAIEDTTREHWWNVRVDATTGVILDRNDWMVSCNLSHEHNHDIAETLNYNANLFDIPNYKAPAETAVGCTNCYEALEMPIESPYYGARTPIVDPATVNASPFGWHDTDGNAGPEFTDTRGNNVDAYEAGDNFGYRPDGGANLEFQGYAFDETWSVGNQYEDAAIVNLFYWNNIIHDVLYEYGFDEASGNFQENNYGNGGSGSDSVNANAQISVWCNATFGTPPDGSNPSMNMYICGNNNNDGCFDNLVVTHEFAHGISNRLTGGPGNTSCLDNSEQMGEGWSDFYGAILTIEPGDTGTDVRAVGTYLFGQGTSGSGIRSFPYTTDMTVNPFTYDDIKSESVPHGVGSVWCTMLWDMTWDLIDANGFDPNIYNFTGDPSQDAGNVMAMALVTEGLKLQPCSPGFVDGRDAILAADQAIYGGANECLIWDAFARRGLGVSADQGSSGSRADGTEAFDTPSGIAAFTAPSDVCANEPELEGLGGGTPSGGVYSGPGVTDDGNGATYSFDPAVAGVGVHTITYDVPAGACSVASSDSDTIEVLAIPPGPDTTGVSDFCPGEEVTVSATLNDPANVIRWFDAPVGGNFLFEGTDYTFTPSGDTSVYALETPPGPLSQLVISEVTLQTPDRFEIQNVGVAADYSGYAVAVSDEPYSDINAVNSDIQLLGSMGGDSVITWNDVSGDPNYWGSNLFWNDGSEGWIIIIDDNGNVVDSLFWNYSAAEIAGFNVTINGFTVTAADLDWAGAGAAFTTTCNDSYRRNGDTDGAADWAAGCQPSDYGVSNDDINLGTPGCAGERTETSVSADTVLPTVTCPSDVIVTVDEGAQYTVPDYEADTTFSDNCTATLSQDPAVGALLDPGVYTVTMTATDDSGNEATCTFELTVDEEFGVADQLLANGIVLYPNPTTATITLQNKSGIELSNATITDVNGRIISAIDLNTIDSEVMIDMNAYSSGVYFITVQSAKATIVKRIVKF